MMVEGYSAVSFNLDFTLPAEPGQERLLYASTNPGENDPASYRVPGGIITQTVYRDNYYVVNTTTFKHPLWRGQIGRIAIEHDGKIWIVTRGIGYNNYGKALNGLIPGAAPAGAYINNRFGPLMFRDLDMALKRHWESKYGGQ
jgi:hypothetical protein